MIDTGRVDRGPPTFRMPDPFWRNLPKFVGRTRPLAGPSGSGLDQAFGPSCEFCPDERSGLRPPKWPILSVFSGFWPLEASFFAWNVRKLHDCATEGHMGLVIAH